MIYEWLSSGSLEVGPNDLDYTDSFIVLLVFFIVLAILTYREMKDEDD